jgi:hypothetical protein
MAIAVPGIGVGHSGRLSFKYFDRKAIMIKNNDVKGDERWADVDPARSQKHPERLGIS